jgi:lipoyl synthase
LQSTMFKKKKVELSKLHEIKKQLRSCNLNTVCEEARCPNISECFGKKTATFMIMGNTCNRGCRFCNIKPGRPFPLDDAEPVNIADTVKEMGLKYVVITSVTRDDLQDGGAGHFAKTIQAVKEKNPFSKIEVLTPDFRGSSASLDTVLQAKPDVFNHNIESVNRLSAGVRPGADYRRSLDVLNYVFKKGARAKSGLMVGLGENMEEIKGTMKDLKDAGVSILTVGQYYAPAIDLSWPVARYYTEAEFEGIRDAGLAMGFDYVFSGRFVRSSYMADDVFHLIRKI